MPLAAFSPPEGAVLADTGVCGVLPDYCGSIDYCIDYKNFTVVHFLVVAVNVPSNVSIFRCGVFQKAVRSRPDLQYV